MSALFIGDCHVTAAELEDAWRLIEGIYGLPYKQLIFLGDQFHTHSVLNLEVVNFWQRATNKLVLGGKDVVFLVGNHDMATNGRGPHAMQVLGDIKGVTIVDKPMRIRPGVGAIPYCASHDDFRRAQDAAMKLIEDDRDQVLVCHQTFESAQYENGFYAHDGFPLADVIFPTVISGHIHSAADIQAPNTYITYVGSPRWRTKSDAGVTKWLRGYIGPYPGAKGAAVENHFTDQWCTPIEVIEDDSDALDPMDKRRWPNSKVTVIVRGDVDRVRRRAAELEARGIAVLPRPTSQVAPRVSEGAPVGTSFQNFLKTFKAPNGTAGARLAELSAGYQQWQ